MIKNAGAGRPTKTKWFYYWPPADDKKEFIDYGLTISSDCTHLTGH